MVGLTISRKAPPTLALPATAPADLEQMLAPSVTSRTGETLAGQSLDQNGRWSGPRRIQVIVPHAQRYRVMLAPYSAALLSVRTAGATGR